MKTSAGILVYRHSKKGIEVLLAHPGGPFWAKKDSWSIPKGEIEEGEELLEAGLREFQEELGFAPPEGEFIELGSAKAHSSKVNHVWAVEGNPDLTCFQCHSMVVLDWPPRSGQQMEFPEVDRIAWHSLDAAKKKLYKVQNVFIDRLAEKLNTLIIDTGTDQTASEQISLL